MSPSGLLIFGTSHVGKSTLAGRIGEALGARITSTDKLARHPGRPWPQIPQPVDEYYSCLTDETIYWFLRVHHENMWPLVQRKIKSERDLGGCFVVEGAALRPELISTLDYGDVLAIGLWAAPDFLRERMQSESDYARRNEHGKTLISKFVSRSLRDNEKIVEDARRLGLRLIDIANPESFENFYEELLDTLNAAKSGSE